MKSMRKKESLEIIVGAEKPIPYRLAFQINRRGVPATLTSSLLDRELHGRRGALAYFRSIKHSSNGQIVLDPFEAASLSTYLQDQPSVRRQLERELDEMLQTWDEDEKIGRGREVWKRTKIESVHFAPRQLATPEQIRFIKKAHKNDAEKILREEFDTRESRSSFTVLMTPEWAEHLLMIQFRDGVAMELRVEG